MAFSSLEMRQNIYKWKHFPVDMVVEPILTIPFSAKNSGYGLHVADDTLALDAANDVVSHVYNNQLEEEEDLEKIKNSKRAKK